MDEWEGFRGCGLLIGVLGSDGRNAEKERERVSLLSLR